MKKSLGTYVWHGFSSSWGPVGTILSIGIAFIIWIFAPQTKVALYWALPLWLLFFLMVFVVFRALVFCVEDNSRVLPLVVSGMKASPSTERETALIILERSALFSHNKLVSVYELKDNKYEVFVGGGRVFNIQENGLIQVVFIAAEGNENIFSEIRNNNKETLKRLIVKPNIGADECQQIMEVDNA